MAACRCASAPWPAPASSTARTRRGGIRSSRAACRASRSRRASPTSGASTWGSRAPWWAWTASASRPRRARSTSSSAWTPSTSSRRSAQLPGGDGIVVRAASVGDAADIAHIHRESWRTTYAGILPLDVIAAQAGRKSEAAWRRRLIEAPAWEVTWIAERGDEAVGIASCGDARHQLEGIEAEIYALYVLQEHQRV